MGAVTHDVVSKRKPFPVGARVARQSDGERGTVESVEKVDGAWDVSVVMDHDGVGSLGRQKTAARGAWTRLSGDAPARDLVSAVAAVRGDMEQDNATDAAPYITEEGAGMYGVSVEDLRAALGVTQSAQEWEEQQNAAQSAQETWDAQEEQERENVAQKRAQGFVCTFAECVVHNK